MFGGFGVGEIMVIVLLLIVLFGSRKIPEIARGLGRGIRNFKADVKDPDQLDGEASDPSERPPRAGEENQEPR